MKSSIRVARLIAPIVLAGLLALQASAPGDLSLLRENATDFLIRTFPFEGSTQQVVMIAVDDRTIAEVGQWPFSRDVFAESIHRITAAGAMAALTVLTSEPDEKSPHRILRRYGLDTTDGTAAPNTDAMLADALADGLSVGPVVVSQKAGPAVEARSGFALSAGYALSNLPGYESTLAPWGPLSEAFAGLGAMTAAVDLDGVVRWVPLVMTVKGELFPSFAAEVLRVAQGAPSIFLKLEGPADGSAAGEITAIRVGALIAPTNAAGNIRFVPGPRDEIARYSLVDLLQGAIPSNALAGRIVVLGVDATGIGERFTDPLGRRLSAMELQAALITQLLDQRALVRPDWARGVEFTLTAVFGATAILASIYLGALLSGAISLVVTLGAVGYWLFSYVYWGYIFDPIVPTATVVASFLLSALAERWVEERRAGWIKKAFSSYVSPNLVQFLSANPGVLTLRGERRELSFVFTDLAGFSRLVEDLDPEALPPLLSAYLDEMARIAFKHDGTIDKFVGDAVHVVFGAPVPQDDHARRALSCAIEMKRFSEEYRRAQIAQGIALGETRIGVNTGHVVVGNFGGDTMFDYTAHGDPINTAARLESANKYFGTTLCVSEFTVDLCDDFEGREIGAVIFKGKTVPVRVFEPKTDEENSIEKSWEAYQAAFDKLSRGDESAKEDFEALHRAYPTDPLVAFHVGRLRQGRVSALIELDSK